MMMDDMEGLSDRIKGEGEEVDNCLVRGSSWCG